VVTVGMQIVIPPGQGLTTAYLSLSRAEASGLRDALDLMLATGSSSGWHAYVSSGDYQTDVTLILETESPTGPPAMPRGTASG
jgi:hypothetical protein